VATILVQSLDLGERVEVVPSEEPGAALDAGAVDALLMTAQAGHPRLHAILRREDRELRPLSAATDVEHTLGHPLLRPARIPAGTYFGQTGPVETVASQVVLATYLPPRGVPVGESGPGVIPGLGRDLPMRLPPRTAASVARALGAPEPVDPLLPSSPGLTPEAPPAREQVAGNPAAAVLNLVAIAFLVLVAGFFALPRPAHPALQRGDAGRSGASRSVAPVRRPREEG